MRMCVPSIQEDRSTLQSHGDTRRHFDMDMSPRTAVHVYLEDIGLHSYEGRETAENELVYSET